MGDDRPEPQRTGRTTDSPVLTPPTGVPVVPDDAESLLEPPRSGDAAVLCSVVPPAGVWILPETDVLAGSCPCGHGAPAHEHWRRGSDCGVCGATACPALRRSGSRARRILRKLRLSR